MARIISPYPKNATPPIVARWEKHAEQANTDSAAEVRLNYELLLQLDPRAPERMNAG